MSRIGIIDYGVGNIRSVANALRAVGAEPVVASDPVVLAGCSRLILPGVGAFPHGMQALAERGLTQFVRTAVAGGTPLLGICLGMQILMQSSTEFGATPGLALISGEIKQFSRSNDNSTETEPLRLPNVGWLRLQQTEHANESALRLLKGIDEHDRFYFVHSYHAAPDGEFAAAISTYDGIDFAAIVSLGAVIGTQFHPEKSGPAGLRMLSNFVG